MTIETTIPNRVYYSRSDIERLIALDMDLEPGPDIEIEWNDDHSAVILVPDGDVVIDLSEIDT